MRCVPRREQEDPAGHDLLRVGQGAAVVLGAIAVESVDVAVSHRVAELGGRDLPQVVTLLGQSFTTTHQFSNCFHSVQAEMLHFELS